MNFIGEKFNTPKGGVLTVLRKSQKGKYILECSVCSKDEELWERGSIQSVKSSLIKGSIPCGCAKRCKYTDIQKGVVLNRTQPSYSLIEVLGLKVSYFCKDCGVHEVSHFGNLLKGHKRCLCSSKYKLPENLMTLKLKNVVNFLEWLEPYKGSKTKFKWLCERGHECISTPDNTLNNTRGCRVCNTSHNGFYFGREQQKDNLYWLELSSSNECFYKIGRSFNVPERLKRLERVYDVKVISVLRGTHLDIYNREQCLLLGLKDRKYTPKKRFTGYTECLDLNSRSTLESTFFLKEISN